MNGMVMFATAAALLAGLPLAASAGDCDDSDGDGVCAELDNCTDVANATQTDTDGDLCGNRCDADFDQSGTVGIADFGSFAASWGGPGIPPGLQDIGEDPPSGTIAIADFGELAIQYGGPAGPSGTTPGTIACPAVGP